ncbi:FixH family protein [uncultured Paenalcaligenes sp.]|uniref:FixH family protein n=1 Tax=uncultured Paenalcaligenes sp. TaxID=1588925 RepID=UPI00260E3B8C|nr:FixH family protein [uncultured Paenalcaligenes sp.]
MRAALREDTQPWYKEPWPWILMSGPAIVVVACLFTIYLAFSNFDQPLSGAIRKGLQVLPEAKVEQVESAPVNR